MAGDSSAYSQASSQSFLVAETLPQPPGEALPAGESQLGGPENLTCSGEFI